MKHPNIYTFLTHLQNVTVDSMADSQRIRYGVEIRRPKKKRNWQNDACIDRYDNGAYTRLQFLRAISHSLGAHTEAFQFASDDDDDDDADPSTPSSAATATVTAAVATATPDMSDVCLMAPRTVPCGHSRFGTNCAEAVANMPNDWPLCRTHIERVLRVFM